MRILIVGAGATGGAFGSRLQIGGRDVTFLAREDRARQLRNNGLRFVGPEEEHNLPAQTLVAGEPSPAFDLIIITVKAPALPSAIVDMRTYVNAHTRILPILNGLSHLNLLEKAYPGQVLGGTAKIVATLKDDTVHQMTDLMSLTIGAPDNKPLSAEIVTACEVAGIDITVSEDILATMWEKWMFIAASGVINCLFRSPVGPILEVGGLPQILQVITEVEAVAAAAGHPVSSAAHDFSISVLTEPGSDYTSSLYRDLLATNPTEADHILGELLKVANRHSVATPLLELVVIQIRANEKQRA